MLRWNKITQVDRRRHPREMTVESLDRDISLMREMVSIISENKGDTTMEIFMNNQEIDRLSQRIPELVDMREGLKGESNG